MESPIASEAVGETAWLFVSTYVSVSNKLMRNLYIVWKTTSFYVILDVDNQSLVKTGFGTHWMTINCILGIYAAALPPPSRYGVWMEQMNE